MGNGHLINQIGYGDATVFNPNQAIQQFGNILAQQKAEQKAKDDALIKQMADLKSDGLRLADKDDYIKQYNDWKTAAIQANNLPKNSKDRLDAIADAQAKYKDLGEFVGRSKEQKGHENALTNMRLSNPHMFSDEADQKVLTSLTSPMSSKSFIPNDQYTTLERYIDPAKIDEKFTKLKDVQLKAQPWGNPIQSQGHDKQGNKTGVLVHNERAVTPEQILTTYAHLYTVDKDTKAYIDKKYHQIEGETEAETKMLRLRQNAIDRGDIIVNNKGQLLSGVTEKTKPEFKANYKPDSFYAHYDYRQGNKEPDSPTYFQDLSERMRNNIAGSGEEFNQVLAQNPDYHKGFIIDDRNKKAVKITIPARYKYDPKAVNEDNAGRPNAGRVVVKPAYTVTLDKTDPNAWTSGLAQIYKDVTGDATARPSKSMTPYGKGHIPNGQSKFTAKQKKQASSYGL